MYDNVLNRKMFQMGGPVMADPSMGTPMQPPPMQPPPMQPPPMQNQGIMTGLEDSQTETALTSVAQDLQQVMTEIDGAENYEGIMNALRGDQATIEQRRTELAQYVGDADSVKTPESVLALTQPTLEILKVTEQAETNQMGGIASLGEPPVNFNQASFTQSPGLDEASMRIGQGEQFVQRAEGTSPFGENIFNNDPLSTNLSSSQAASPYASLLNPSDAIAQYTKENYASNLGMVTDAMVSQKPKTFSENIEIAKKAGLMKSTANTTEEILAGYKNVFGEDKNYNDLMANLNLVGASSQLMQDTRPFTEALGGAFSTYAKGAIESKKAEKAQERSLKLAAIQTRDAQVLADVTRSQDTLSMIYKATEEEGQVYSKALLDTTGKIFSETGKDAREVAKANNDLVLETVKLRNARDGKPLLTFTNKDGTKLVDVRRVGKYSDGTKSESGLAMVDPESRLLVPVPAGYRHIEGTELSQRIQSLGPSGLGKGLTQVKMTIPVVPTEENGNQKFKNIQTAVYSKDLGQVLYRPEIIDPVTKSVTYGDLVSVNELKVPYFVGQNAEDFEELEVTDTGTLVVRTDPDTGQKTYVRTHMVNPQGQTIVDLLTPQRLEALQQTDAVDKETGKNVITGTAYVVQDDAPPSVTAYNSDESLTSTLQKRLQFSESFLFNARTLLKNNGFENTVGLTAGAKNLSNVVLAPFSSLFDSEWGSFASVPSNQSLIKQLKRSYIGSNILSDRYAVAEQDRLAAMIGSDRDLVEWFQSPDLSAAEFKELVRGVENIKQDIIGYMTAQPITRIEKVPTGQPSDPHNLGNIHGRTYIEKQIQTYQNLTSDREKAVFRRKLDNTYVTQTKAQVERALAAETDPDKQETLQSSLNTVFGDKNEIVKPISFFYKGILDK